MDKEYGEDYNKEFDTYKKVASGVALGGIVLGGLGKEIAKRNQKKAEELYNNARNSYMDSFCVFEESVKRTKKTIVSVVSLKKKIMKYQMKRFLKSYRRLAPQFRLQYSKGLDELNRFIFQQEDFQDIEKTTHAYLSYREYRLGEKAANVALLMVQDGTITNLAYCMKDVMQAAKMNDKELKNQRMDNLKIQSIGLISEFSTVAVEFALSGITDTFSSIKQLSDAKKIAAEFDQQREILKINNTKISAIDRYANDHLILLNKFAPLVEDYVSRAVCIIKSKDNVFRLGRIQQEQFTQHELEILAFTFSLVGAVKAVIDSPIISKDGGVFDGDVSQFNQVQNSIETFERKCIEMKQSI